MIHLKENSVPQRANTVSFSLRSLIFKTVVSYFVLAQPRQFGEDPQAPLGPYYVLDPQMEEFKPVRHRFCLRSLLFRRLLRDYIKATPAFQNKTKFIGLQYDI